MKLRIFISIAIAAQVFSTAVHADHRYISVTPLPVEVCARYSALVSDLANRLYNLKPEVVSAANKTIDTAKIQNFAARLKCTPVDSLPSGRAAETSKTATGFETKLDWRRVLLYSRMQVVDFSGHEISVGLEWEDSDVYSEVSRAMRALYFRHYIDHSKLPTKCLGEHGFDSTGMVFTCVEPRVEQNGVKSYVSSLLLNRQQAPHRDTGLVRNAPAGDSLCQRMGFSSSVDSRSIWVKNFPEVVALTKEGRVGGESDSGSAFSFVSCKFSAGL